MNKELEEKMDELLELINKTNKKKRDENIDTFRKNANRIINESEETLVIISEKEVATMGSTYDVTCAMFSGLQCYLKDHKIPKKLIKEAFNKILKETYDNDEEESSEIDELEKMIKDIFK